MAVWLAYLAWPVLSCILFRYVSGPKAAFGVLFGGWAVLPVVAVLPPGLDSMPGVALPGSGFFTKASVIGLSALLGALVFHREHARGFRFRPLDGVVLSACLLPGVSAIANGRGVSAALFVSGYHFATWGAMWLTGRLFVAREEEQEIWARGLVWAGLAYLPVVLVEFPGGPFLHEALYGRHSYQGIGADRYLGHRGMGFLEDGNQLGMWLAIAAVAATWLWRRQALIGERRGRLALAAGLLVGATVLAQSVGSVLLMAAGIAMIPLSRSRAGRVAVLAVGLVVVGWSGLRFAGVVDTRSAVEKSPLARSVRDWLKSIGRGSLGYRLKQNEIHLSRALEKPALGWGRTDWWDPDERGRPRGLWSIALGAWGFAGLILLAGTVLVPPFLLVLRRGASLGNDPPGLPSAGLAVVVLLCAADAILNSTFLLPVVAIAGGLTADRTARTKAAAGEC
jgi:hypothetical protein